MKSMISPSGGLFYHWKALRYRRTLWRNYISKTQETLKAWVDQLPESTDTLILVGPSGGYSLPLEALGEFRLVVIDVDPMAHLILKFRLNKRFRQRPKDVHLYQDYLLDASKPMENALEPYPDAAVLFCNVWGQISLMAENSEDVLHQWRGRLAQFLNNRNWLSYHDRLSTTQTCQPKKLTHVDSKQSSIESLIREFLPDAKGVVEDHGTTGLFPETRDARYILWELMPSRYHVIEVLTNNS